MRHRVEVCLAVCLAAWGVMSAEAGLRTRSEKSSGEAPPPTRVIVRLREAAGATSFSSTETGAFVTRHRARQMRALHARHRQGDAGAAARRRFAPRAARAPRQARLPRLDGTYVLDLGLRTPGELARALASLRADPQVLHAEPDTLAGTAYVPNDPHFALSGSWGQPYDDLYGLKAIDASTAWETARGAGVIVAVIDTGIDYTHPDIDANIWINTGEIPGNGIDDDGNGFVDDRRGWDFIGATYMAPAPDNDPADGHGHGTHVAGTVAAEGDNTLGVVGVAWQARVMALKGLDDGGWGPVSGLAQAIVYAADNGADVINASWGGDASDTVRDAVSYAHGLGVVFVAAAGNNDRDAALFHPASHRDAITVAAVDATGAKASFSNFGNKIDVAAPGVDILSLERGTGGYLRLDGTSMAAPHVSGLAALLIEAHPDFTNEQIRSALRASAFDLGTPGKDPLFGYGRLDAAAAVATTEALEVRLLGPRDGAPVHQATSVVGTVRGLGFDHYILEVGAGTTPTSWTTLAVGTAAVTAGPLAAFDPSAFAEGLCTVRVRAASTSGRTFSDQIHLLVRYAALTWPPAARVPVVAHVHRSGAALAIHGTAAGPGFVRYRLEWAPGSDATSGWSTAGVTLVNGGTAITEGVLGEWTPAAALSGAHTIRLTVETSAATTARSVTVYLEPDLLSTAWPQYIPDNSRTRHSPVPVRQADGSTKLLLGGRSRDLLLFSPDGHSKSVLTLNEGGDWPPSVGELDPTAGDEIVTTDGSSIRILSAALAPLRTITTPRPERFGFDLTSLADLDGDGTLEIVTVARHTQEAVATLQVYRADGSPFSNRYPVVLFSAIEPMYVADIATVAADLDGDGLREIVAGVLAEDGARYTLRAFRADGSPYSPWPTPEFPAAGLNPLVAADLDHDGRQEIVVHELLADGERLRVVDGQGTTRPGWPRRFGPAPNPNGGVAIGDLDRDQHEELVFSIDGGVLVLRHDGTDFARLTWPTTGPTGPPVLADVDGDDFPDIVVGYGLFDFSAPVVYPDMRLRAVSRTGALLEEWRLFGVQGWTAGMAMAAVGDFDGDGRTDFAVNQHLDENSGVVSGVMRVLTNGRPFRPQAADWPMLFGDARNSRSKAAALVTVKVAPVADAYVRGGEFANTSFGTATTLEVKQKTGTGASTRVAYLRFPLVGVGGGVSTATLRLYGKRPTATPMTVSAFAVGANNWTETALTWNNRPALGAPQGAGVTIETTPRYYEWDVTAFVRAQCTAHAGAVTLALRMDDNTRHSPDGFTAREAAEHRPQLVLTARPRN